MDVEMDPRRRVEETWEGKLSYSSRGARLVVVYVLLAFQCWCLVLVLCGLVLLVIDGL